MRATLSARGAGTGSVRGEGLPAALRAEAGRVAPPAVTSPFLPEDHVIPSRRSTNRRTVVPARPVHMQKS